MNNHADNFRPPDDNTTLGDAKQTFQFISGIFMIAVHVTGAFWAMIAKKPGSVGTRAYWFDVLSCNTLLLALSHNWWYPDRLAFQGAIAVNTGLWLWHLWATINQEEHVHTHCIGASRFGAGDNGKFREAMIGLISGLCIVLIGFQYFGFFIVASAGANAIRIMMVDERDRQRSVQIADAIAEQEYMMNQYEKFKRERSNR